jgi:hypothetical protein
MSYIDELERGGICPDCGGLEECRCVPFIDDEPYPGFVLDEDETK